MKSFVYKPELNPDGRFFPGVPLTDISAEAFVSYRPSVQRAIEEAPFYEEVVISPPPPPKKDKKDGD